MKSSCLCILLAAAACQNPSANGAFAVRTTVSNLPDGGTAMSDGQLLYVSGGSLAVTVTLDAGQDTFVESTSAPAHASIQIDAPQVPAGGVAAATVPLIRKSDGTLFGTAALSWPPGGTFALRTSAAGQVVVDPISLETPQLAVAVGAAAQQTAALEVVPICVQSSTANGTVSVHLDRATFAAPAGASDLTAPLEPGDCGFGGAAPPFTVNSHALLSALPAADPAQAAPALVAAFQVTPALQGYPSIPSTTPVPVPALQPVVAAIVSPATGTAVAPGTLETLQARASLGPKGAPLTNFALQFVALPNVAIVPGAAATDRAGNLTATFVMPNLNGGSLAIQLLGGTVNGSIVLTN